MALILLKKPECHNPSHADDRDDEFQNCRCPVRNAHHHKRDRSECDDQPNYAPDVRRDYGRQRQRNAFDNFEH